MGAGLESDLCCVLVQDRAWTELENDTVSSEEGSQGEPGPTFLLLLAPPDLMGWTHLLLVFPGRPQVCHSVFLEGESCAAFLCMRALVRSRMTSLLARSAAPPAISLPVSDITGGQLRARPLTGNR